jgi:hypothetical protein
MVVPWAAMTVDKFMQQNAAQNAAEREFGMYGDFVVFDEAGKLEKGERVYLGDVKGKNEGWLRDTLFENPEIIPVKDIDSTFGPLVPLCKQLRAEVGQINAVFINERGRLT